MTHPANADSATQPQVAIIVHVGTVQFLLRLCNCRAARMDFPSHCGTVNAQATNLIKGKCPDVKDFQRRTPRITTTWHAFWPNSQQRTTLGIGEIIRRRLTHSHSKNKWSKIE